MKSQLTDIIRSQLHKAKYDKNPQDLKQSLEDEGYIFKSFDNTKTANDMPQQQYELPEQATQQEVAAAPKDPEEVLLDAVTATPSDYGLDNIPPSQEYMYKKQKEQEKEIGNVNYPMEGLND